MNTMPPHGRPDFGPGGPQQQQIDPAQQLVSLKLRRAQLKSQRPSDEDFEALLDAQAAAQRQSRDQQAQAISDVEAAIAALESAPAEGVAPADPAAS